MLNKRPMTQETLRYSRTAMLLHWAIALLLMLNFGLGERTEHLEKGPELVWAMELHKSIGISILLLTAWRLALRLFTARPAKAADSDILQFFSALVHWGFYAVMVFAPLTGWLIVSTARDPAAITVFGVVPWPLLPNFGHGVHEVMEGVHELLAKLMVPLLALHLLGAVRHQFLLKDALVERMVPAKRVTLLGFVLLVASLVLAFVAGKNFPAPVYAEPGERLADFQTAALSPPNPAVDGALAIPTDPQR